MREDNVHPISIPLMNLSAAAFQTCTIYVMTHPFVKLPTAVILSFFMMYKSKRHPRVFVTCSFKQISPCNLFLSSPDPFLFFFSQKLHSGFIILSSRSQQDIAQTLQTGSFFTGWLPSYPAGCVTTNGGYVTDSRRTRVLALERRCSVASGHELFLFWESVYIYLYKSACKCSPSVHNRKECVYTCLCLNGVL